MVGYGDFGSCLGTANEVMVEDTDLPESGAAFFYLVTGVNAIGDEGTLGFASCTERSNFVPCS